MSSKYQTKLRKARYSISPLNPQSMANIGNSALGSIFSRWDSSQDVYDLGAKPLAEGYAYRKANPKPVKEGFRSTQVGFKPIRDLLFSGRLRRSLKVITATQNKCVLGPVGGPIYRGRKNGPPLTAGDVLRINNRRHRMWGVSPRDKQAIVQAVIRAFREVGVKAA